jgi:hypothetical protein
MLKNAEDSTVSFNCLFVMIQTYYNVILNNDETSKTRRAVHLIFTSAGMVKLGNGSSRDFACTHYAHYAQSSARLHHETGRGLIESVGGLHAALL